MYGHILTIALSIGVTLLSVETCAQNITDQVFGSYNKFMPAAFGDFNNDKHTDMFVIETDKKNNSCVVKVLLAYVDPPLLRPDGPLCQCPGDNVKSVVPGDFDGDGALDMMMLSLQSDGLYDVYIAWGDLKNLSCPSEKILTTHGQPLKMDYNGDMIADLFGQTANDTRSFWLFNPTRTAPEQLVMLSDNAKLPPLRIPSSHGFVDLNGDLAADLFITAENQFEIWINTAKGFNLKETIPIPKWAKVVGQTTFMDIGLTGHNDLITVLCGASDCSDGQVYVWSLGPASSGNNKFVTVGFPLVDAGGKAWKYPSSSSLLDHPYIDTITLRVADHNLDGYPDLLLTLLDSSDVPQVVLALNRPCSDTACFNHTRRLEPDWSLLAGYPRSVMATFFDVFEDGRVDVLLLHQETVDGPFAAAAITDTQQYDAMFLKVLVPSGRCYGDCRYHTVPYGSSPAGPSFRYTITTGDRSLQMSVATQLSQSAHMALQLPYTLFGLGRNWNFVEVLQVGLPIKDTPVTNYGFYSNMTAGRAVLESEVRPSHFPSLRNFTQIIPNSQVIVIPYPLDRPDRWVTKLYITPSKTLTLTAAALLVVCLLVAVVIAVLHYREKLEDRKEKLQQAQTFHFDAM